MQPFSAFRQLRKSLNLTKKIILSFMWALFFLTVSTNASFKLFLCFSCYHVSTNSIALPFSLRTSHNTQFLNLLCRRVNINTWAFSVKNVFLWPSLPLKNFFLHHSILCPKGDYSRTDNPHSISHKMREDFLFALQLAQDHGSTRTWTNSRGIEVKIIRRPIICYNSLKVLSREAH